jgi:hypothetical protein
MAYRRPPSGWPGITPGHELDITGRTLFDYTRVSENPDPQERTSIEGQIIERDRFRKKHALSQGESYSDEQSAFTGKERPDYARMRHNIRAGKHAGQLLWFWQSDRNTRGDVPVETLIRESITGRIAWAYGNRVYNPADPDDQQALEDLYGRAKAPSRARSKDVKSRKEIAAYKGRPAVMPLYGYQREYQHGADGQIVLIGGRPVILGDVPDGVPGYAAWLGEQGINAAVPGYAAGLDASHLPASPGSPAAIVQEIFRRLQAGETPTAIAEDLRARRVRRPRFPPKCTVCGRKTGKARACPLGHEQDLYWWPAATVAGIGDNPGYIGRRVHGVGYYRPEERVRYILRDDGGNDVRAWWPQLVTEAQFWAVHRIRLERKTVRAPGRGQRRLLSSVARSLHCGGALAGSGGQRLVPVYSCDDGCTAISADWLERWAEDRLVSALALPEVRALIWSRRGEDESVTNARITLGKEEVAREKFYEDAEAGRHEGKDVELLDRMIKGIKDRIAAAEDIIRAAGEGPPLEILARAGLDAADRWWQLRTEDPHAARQVLAEFASIWVSRAETRSGGTARRGAGPGRPQWTWNTGAVPQPPPARADITEARTERRRALRQTRDQVAELLTADPSRSDSWIGTEAECDYHLVQRVRRELARDGRITDPGYRRSASGKRLSVTHGSGRETGPAEDAAEALVASRDATRADDVIARLGYKRPTAHNILARLARAGRIRRMAPGTYAPAGER